MKLSTIAFLMSCSAFAALPAGQAFANADEDAQIAQCVDDNSDSGQTENTIEAYCACASEKVGSFGVSITDWEKNHADEQEACSKQAKWKY
ncbi:MAG: hypothetical protein JWM58_2228 [Rhizobium sp.]|nr:hypothetical protein [Rhizobium sp.]